MSTVSSGSGDKSGTSNTGGANGNGDHHGTPCARRKIRRWKRISVMLTAASVGAGVYGAYHSGRSSALARHNNELQAENVRLITQQTTIQREASAFDQDYRSVEITFALYDQWEKNLDPETRRRLGSYVACASRWSKEETPKAVRILVDEKLGNNAAMIRENPCVMELLCLSEAEAKDDKRVAEEVSAYRTAVIKVLNTFEAVAMVRNNACSQRVRQIVDDGYREIIQTRTDQLMPFVETYSQSVNPAWLPLTDLVYKGDWKQRPLTQTTTAPQVTPQVDPQVRADPQVGLLANGVTK